MENEDKTPNLDLLIEQAKVYPDADALVQAAAEYQIEMLTEWSRSDLVEALVSGDFIPAPDDADEFEPWARAWLDEQLVTDSLSTDGETPLLNSLLNLPVL